MGLRLKSGGNGDGRLDPTVIQSGPNNVFRGRDLNDEDGNWGM